MNMQDAVEDAFLSALEDGANPPKTFNVYMDWDDLVELPSVLSVAGYTIKFRAEDLKDLTTETVH